MVVFGTFFLFLIMFFNRLKILLLKNEEKLINWAQFYNKMIYILDINCILYILSTPWETLFSLDHGLRGRLNFKSVISYKVQFMERRPFLPSSAKAQAQLGLSWLYSQLIQPPPPTHPRPGKFF